ncbi:hypothetical protein CK203_098592 [Vitis vinifera]|uniref:DUF659 domain-containing protein n=1 Tax=Vitis vinifera TaxID=29760 RepID=A0A438E4V3_VITVI|nr:hypothetical protein CK203_098592 [Vitis vinifera]
MAKSLKLPNHITIDAGRTQIAPSSRSWSDILRGCKPWSSWCVREEDSKAASSWCWGRRQRVVSSWCCLLGKKTEGKGFNFQTDRTRKPTINFMIYCDRSMIYHSSVDTTNIPKTVDYIFSLMDKVVEEVGEENVVQVVTDNEASFKAAREVQTIMEPLVKVLKLVDQDKKATLSNIYEVMDRAKLAIKASIKQWEKYWEVIDKRWEDEWIREGEEPILSSDNLDWLDKGLPTNEEGRKRDVDSHRKGKASRTISSSSSSDDGDNRGNRRGGGTSGGNRGVVGTSEGTGGYGSTGGGYVSQVDPDMSWAQGGENYYATQNTDHGYRPGIWEQRKHLERLTTFPSDDDYFSGHDYHRSNYHRIDEHLQNLGIGSRPYFRGGYSNTGTRASGSYGYDQSSSSSSIAYRGFGYYQYGVDPKQPSKPYFPDYGSSRQ